LPMNRGLSVSTMRDAPLQQHAPRKRVDVK
jgi:hypothetical protein